MVKGMDLHWITKSWLAEGKSGKPLISRYFAETCHPRGCIIICTMSNLPIVLLRYPTVRCDIMSLINSIRSIYNLKI